MVRVRDERGERTGKMDVFTKGKEICMRAREVEERTEVDGKRSQNVDQ